MVGGIRLELFEREASINGKCMLRIMKEIRIGYQRTFNLKTNNVFIHILCEANKNISKKYNINLATNYQ